MYTTTNYSGGVQGGISNGMPILLRVAYKVLALLVLLVQKYKY